MFVMAKISIVVVKTVHAFHVTGTCQSDLVIYFTSFDLIHLQNTYPCVTLGKKSQKDMVAENAVNILG